MRYQVNLSAIEEVYVTRTVWVEADTPEEATAQAEQEARDSGYGWERDGCNPSEIRDIMTEECIDENSPEFEGDDDEQDDEEDFPDPYIARDGRG